MRGQSGRGGGSRFLYEPFESNVEHEIKEYRQLLQTMVPTEDIRKKFGEIDILIEERRRRVWLFNTIKTIAGWAVVVSAGWVAFRGFITELITGLQQ